MVNLVALAVEILGGLGAVAEIAQGDDPPLIRVTEAGGARASSQGPNLTRGDIQLDVWAPTKGDAWQLAADAWNRLLEAPRTAPRHPAGVAVQISVTSPSYQPDPDLLAHGRPCPRYLMFARIAAHT